MKPAEEPDGMPMLCVRFSLLPAQSTMGTWAAWQQSFGVAPLLPTALQALQNLSCALEACRYVGGEYRPNMIWCNILNFHFGLGDLRGPISSIAIFQSKWKISSVMWNMPHADLTCTLYCTSISNLRIYLDIYCNLRICTFTDIPIDVMPLQLLIDLRHSCGLAHMVAAVSWLLWDWGPNLNCE